jgi:hypothetical protein
MKNVEFFKMCAEFRLLYSQNEKNSDQKSSSKIFGNVSRIESILLTCSPDPTTNSETMNLNFHESFDQLERVLQPFFLYFWLLLRSFKW